MVIQVRPCGVRRCAFAFDNVAPLDRLFSLLFCPQVFWILSALLRPSPSIRLVFLAFHQAAIACKIRIVFAVHKVI